MNPHRNHDGQGARHPQHHPSEMFDRPEGGLVHRGHGRGSGRGRGGRGRVPRGDVRTAVLLLLAEQSMHGYQLMQSIAERSGGRWTPSPGAIYPAINLLEDESLVTVTAESGRRLVALTDAGRELVEANRGTWPDPFAAFDQPRGGPDLRDLLEQLHGAIRQVGRTGADAQIQAAAKILADARREMYLLLADGPPANKE